MYFLPHYFPEGIGVTALPANNISTSVRKWTLLHCTQKKVRQTNEIIRFISEFRREKKYLEIPLIFKRTRQIY